MRQPCSFLRSGITPLLLALALPALAAAQTTGTIVGTVQSDAQSVMPGVTVAATSPALQGSRSAISDDHGVYRLAFLPPGQYKVTFTLPGFRTETTSVPVSLGRDTTLDMVVHPETAEEITVVAAAPVVDTTSTTVGTTLGATEIQTLPTGRNYTSVVQVAPGVSTDASNNNLDQSTITVYGSSGAENVYYVDGVNTTNLEYGFQGKELNFEFIQEVDVKTGGYEAEFGKSTGGVINVITKSGGNELHGDVFGYRDDDGWQSSAEPVVATTGVLDGYRRQDWGADLGGYILPDRLWFFGAYDRVDNTTDRVLDRSALDLPPVAASSKSQRDLGAAKLTYRLNDNQSLVASYLQDPRDDSGAIVDKDHTLNGEPSTYLGVQSFGGRDLALRYEGLFAAAWSATAQVARHREENSVGPATAAGSQVQLVDLQQNGFQTGGFGLVQDKSFERRFGGASLSRFFGASEIKGGVEYERETADVTKHMSGGQQVFKLDNPAEPDRPIYEHFYWTTLDATVANAPTSELVASPEHEVTTAYLQTRWVPRSDLTVNVGLRWDRQQIFDAAGKGQIDLDNDYAPRLGVVWTPPGKTASRLYASYGRYYEQIPMDLVIRSFSYERQPKIFNFDPVSVTPDPQADADHVANGGQPSAIFGGAKEPADPNLKNQYLTEAIVGYEREVLPEVAVGIKGIYRDYGRVIEDFLCDDAGDYCIGNPGEGIMKQIFTLDYSTTYPAPKPKRTFEGVELDVNKRLSHNWRGMASYLYSKLDGNFDGLYAPFTNVGADPNISAAYDYYDFFTNGRDLSVITNEGALSNDRRHQLKVSGIFTTPFRLDVGLSAYYRTGTPVTRYGYSDIYGRYEFFLTRRGAEGRTPDEYEADLHLGYPLAVGPVTVNLLADVFNLLDAQRPILLDERWGFQEADNTSPTPVNPDYLKPVLRTPPRTFRLGVRLTF